MFLINWKYERDFTYIDDIIEVFQDVVNSRLKN